MSTKYSPKIVTDGLVMYIDAGNIKSFRGEPTTNVVPNPLDLFAWCINGATFATLSRDTSSLASPAGGIPMRMTTTGSDPYTSTYNGSSFNLSAASQGQVWTMSVWAKANRSLTCELFLFEANSSGVYINLSTVGINVTTEWQRFTLSRTNSEATVAYVQVRLDGPNTYSAGDIVWWDGLQVEQKAYATTFVSGSRGTTVETGGGLYDLTKGGNNGTLTNGPLFDSDGGGSISFDGTNDYSNSGTTPTSLQGNPNITVIGFFKRTSSFSTKGFWGIGGSNAGGVGQGICNWNYNNTNEITIDSWSQSTFTTGQTYPLNTWIGVCWRKVLGPMTRANCTVSIFDGKNITNYTGNGLTVLRGEATIDLVINSTGGLTIGSISVDTGYCVPVKVGNISIYNKVLSDIEVLQNFNATKGRFGIK